MGLLLLIQQNTGSVRDWLRGEFWISRLGPAIISNVPYTKKSWRKNRCDVARIILRWELGTVEPSKGYLLEKVFRDPKIY
ncbi:unnamed protein product [Allacma fusca]|uniref:Uncharacterized protein n=1 Tax=Allacma fusca TaxID=39272 RepID=A0A8J2JW35_9HEXA|nr:unnamed protein product [Allacma fusca]